MPLNRQQLFDHVTTEHGHRYFFRPDKATLEDDHGRLHATVPLVTHMHPEGELPRSAVVGMLAAGRELLNRAEAAMGTRRAAAAGLDEVLDGLDSAIVAYEPSGDRYDRASRTAGAVPGQI